MLASSERVAFYLQLHIERYAQLKNQGKALTVEAFNFPQAQLIARFTDHMEAGLRQALKVVSCPRFVTDDLFLELGAQFLGGRAAVSFKELRQYSFWEAPEAVEGVARYRLHNVMREQLQALLQKDEAVLFREVHTFLFEYYDGVFERVEAIEQQVLNEAGLASKYVDYVKFQEIAKPFDEELQGLYERFDEALVEGLYHLERLEVMRLAEWLGTRNHLYYQLAKYSFSQPLWLHTLLIIQSQIGEETDEAALCMNNLAELYRAQGQYEQAKPLYERALAIREQVLGANHPDTAQSLNNLAALYRAQGQYEQAEPLYVRALGIRKQVLGVNHPATAQSLNNLAALYYAQGQYEQAEPLYVRALGICEQVLGANHPDTATSVSNLAVLYRAQGQYEQAEPLYVRALGICEQVLGANHPATANSLNNLAELYRVQGQYEQAKHLHERALVIREQVLGANHRDTANSLNNLAWLYEAQGQYAQAEPLYGRALAIFTNVLGENHPNTQIVKNNHERLKAKMQQNSEQS
ncbi:MAG: tetratricopeptide repeat protein [Thiofilum sp.]|nr:tetratricopeptide repeat protein [Thiofilum sp.]